MSCFSHGMGHCSVGKQNKQYNEKDVIVQWAIDKLYQMHRLLKGGNPPR